MSNDLTDVFVKGLSGVLTKCPVCERWIPDEEAFDTFLKGESGMFIKCSRCEGTIAGGEDIYIPVQSHFETPYIQGYTLHKPVCAKCHSAMIEEQGKGGKQ